MKTFSIAGYDEPLYVTGREATRIHCQDKLIFKLKLNEISCFCSEIVFVKKKLLHVPCGIHLK